VGADGLFDAAVPPGRYRVSAIPKPELGLATAYADWTIAAEPADQSGRTIEFGAPAFISGTALLSPSGSAFGASVRASATPWKIQENVLEAEFGASPKIPFASGGIVGEAGRFEISAEEGTYDFSVQPETRSNFPWYVRPATEVTPDGRSLDFRVPLPVIYRGRVMIGDEGAQATVPSALLRVYAYVTLEGKYSVTPTESVVQIAEARANESGAFTLLIPASLDSRR
jgi:hypothetical protein